MLFKSLRNLPKLSTTFPARQLWHFTLSANMDDPLLVDVEVWYVAQCPLHDLGDVRGVLAANTLVIVAEVGDAPVLYDFQPSHRLVSA